VLLEYRDGKLQLVLHFSVDGGANLTLRQVRTTQFSRAAPYFEMVASFALSFVLILSVVHVTLSGYPFHVMNIDVSNKPPDPFLLEYHHSRYYGGCFDVMKTNYQYNTVVPWIQNFDLIVTGCGVNWVNPGFSQTSTSCAFQFTGHRLPVAPHNVTRIHVHADYRHHTFFFDQVFPYFAKRYADQGHGFILHSGGGDSGPNALHIAKILGSPAILRWVLEENRLEELMDKSKILFMPVGICVRENAGKRGEELRTAIHFDTDGELDRRLLRLEGSETEHKAGAAAPAPALLQEHGVMAAEVAVQEVVSSSRSLRAATPVGTRNAGPDSATGSLGASPIPASASASASASAGPIPSKGNTTEKEDGSADSSQWSREHAHRMLQATMATATKHWSDRKNRVYLCFTQGPYEGRKKFLEYVRAGKCPVCDYCSDTMPAIDLWKKYGEYKYVLSPHGNGVDCGRSWEIMLMGAIPVIEYWPGAVGYAQAGLAATTVTQPEELTEQLLEAWGRQFHRGSDPAKLTAAYWAQYVFNESNLVHA
jgi:hypothetical protein